MTTNPYFNNYNFPGTQGLLKDLGTEMIQKYGIDVYYMPRSHVNIDKLYLEDTLSYFSQATTLEMYIKTFQGWQGEGDLMTKFGISMADQITFSLMRHRFEEEITTNDPSYIRPLEGDLIYLPLTHAVFEIKFVEHEANFYQTGQLTYYDIKCERFNYSSENISTGVTAIDNIMPKFSFADDDYVITDQDGNNIVDDSGDNIEEGQYSPDKIDTIIQNDYFSDQGKSFIDSSSKSPFSN